MDLDTQIFGYIDIWLHGYRYTDRDTWIYRHSDARIYGYTDTWKLIRVYVNGYRYHMIPFEVSVVIMI